MPQTHVSLHGLTKTESGGLYFLLSGGELSAFIKKEEKCRMPVVMISAKALLGE